MTDEELIKMICLGGKASDEALHYMYDQWSDKAISNLGKYNKNIADSENIVHDAIVILENHVRNGKYQPTGRLEHYFYGICKWQSLGKLQQKKKIVLVADQSRLDRVEEIQPETKMIKAELKDVVNDVLKMMEKTCRDILHLYMWGYSMKEIALELDLKNDDDAKYHAYRCRKRMRQLIERKPRLHNYLKRRNEA